MADVEKTSLPKKLPAAPEAVLKRRKRRVQQQAAKVQTSLKHRAQQYKKKTKNFKRAEQYVKEYHMKNRDVIRLKRQAINRGNYYRPEKHQLAFVIKIRATSTAAVNVQKIMALLRLKHVNTGIFLKLNKATTNILRICEPFITWGYPNLKSVRELIFKRGFAKIDGKRTPITSNAIIEQKLGSHGLICTEDLVHEIFTAGEKFKEASNFLWSFKLNTPQGGWQKITNHFNNGGAYGNREDKINELLRLML